MRVLSVVVALLLAVPALAQSQKPGRDRDRDDRREELTVEPFEGPVVAAHRGELLRQLSDANMLVDDSIARAKKSKDRRTLAELKEIKAALAEMREALGEAPELRMSRDGRRMVVDLDDNGWRWMRRSNQWKREWDQPGPVVTAPPPSNPPPARPGPGSNVYPISEGELRGLVSTIDREGFPQSRLRVLEQAATSRYFLIQQVKTLLTEFSYSGDRLKAVEILKPRILDPENADQLYAAFEFSNDKEQLREILRR